MDADLPYIGQIVPTAANFAPMYWGICDGQILPFGQYQALYSLLGTTYGGSHSAGTFGLPNLNGRVGCGYGPSTPFNAPLSVSQTFGHTTVQLTTANLPSHGHGVALMLGVGVDYTTGNGTQGVPPSGGLLANAVAGTATVDVYAPISASSPISATLPVTLTGTPTITAGPAGGSPSGGTAISVIQPTLAMYMCIALNGEYPVNE
jgi:microcystin-dependent protein